jgi:aminocarboxymuconate-semialdehyde decarboxylase
VREIDCAINSSATGVQIFSIVNARHSTREYRRSDRMAAHRLPIWMHPPGCRRFLTTGESRSTDIWWAFGWPYETTAAMARLVFDGLFDRHPELQIITHHMGAMVPHFEGRAGYGLDQLGTRTDDPDDLAAAGRLRRRPVDYFRMFYGDTALFGASHAMGAGWPSSRDHVLFSTDMPSTSGPGFIRETIAAMERMRARRRRRRSTRNARRMRLRLR